MVHAFGGVVAWKEDGVADCIEMIDDSLNDDLTAAIAKLTLQRKR
jgi:hypothetical protein